MEVKSSYTSKNFIYSGGHKKFTALDAPGLILTQLQVSDFSHIETDTNTVDLVVKVDGKLSRMRFEGDSFYKFMIVLKDQSILDPNELDEHIVLRS